VGSNPTSSALSTSNFGECDDHWSTLGPLAVRQGGHPGLLQRIDDEKVSKERMHLDLETDDIEAEVQRLEALGATRYDHQQERGFDFWVMRDPWGNEFCVLHPNFPELLARRRPWPT
jgi:hypothetical protein